jgi:two-component system, chemotaxis family, response regulator Rcp1
MTDPRGNTDKSARIAQQTKLFKGFGKDFHVILFPFNWKHPERHLASTGIDVLVVEDNASDAELIGQFIGESQYKCRVVLTANAAEATTFLANYKNDPARILLVLLDLILPDESGFELLRKIRNQPEFSDLPVSIISASTAPRDIAEALELEVASYIAKPKDLEHYVKLTKAFDELIFSMFEGQIDSGVYKSKQESESTRGGSDANPSSDSRFSTLL